MVDRKFLSDLIYNACTSKKVTLLFGARQVCKSTLLKQFLNEQEKKKKTYKLINADNYYDRAYFNNTDKITLINELSQYDYLAIDEAQKLEEMDLFIKNFADYVKTESRLILTG
jgi:predicted AAA+ superfamily ATPase